MMDRIIKFDGSAPTADVFDHVCEFYAQQLEAGGGVEKVKSLMRVREYIDENPGVPFGRALRQFIEVMRRPGANDMWPVQLFIALRECIPDRDRQVLVTLMSARSAGKLMRFLDPQDITPRERKIIRDQHWKNLDIKARRRFP